MAISEKAKEFAGFPVVQYSPVVGIVLPTMPRRVFHKAGTTEEPFWAIALDGDRLHIDDSDDGSIGRKSTRALSDATTARDEYSWLISSILKKGYAERTELRDNSGTREAILAALRDDPNDGVSRMALADYLEDKGEQFPAVAYRIEEAGYGDPGYGTIDTLKRFLSEPAVGLVHTLVIGSCWAATDSGQSSAEVVQVLIGARDRLTGLRALFLGDIPYQECEISWIVHSDLTDLLLAFPKLEQFRTRGGNQLAIRPFEHHSFRSLAIEASNLPREVVRNLGECKLPALEHLELWLGTSSYGADTTPDDLSGIFRSRHLPSLRSLGLRNSEIIDDVARSLSGGPLQQPSLFPDFEVASPLDKAPLLEQLRVLDLSLGMLSDRGAEALLTVIPATKLERLDITHHYVSPDLVRRLEALGVEVDAGDAQEPEDPDEPEAYRYVAHSE